MRREGRAATVRTPTGLRQCCVPRNNRSQPCSTLPIHRATAALKSVTYLPIALRHQPMVIMSHRRNTALSLTHRGYIMNTVYLMERTIEGYVIKSERSASMDIFLQTMDEIGAVYNDALNEWETDEAEYWPENA